MFQCTAAAASCLAGVIFLAAQSHERLSDGTKGEQGPGSMVAHVTTVAFLGLEARTVDVQVQIANGVPARSEERRVGKECASTCRSRWSPSSYKHKKRKTPTH